MDYADESYWLRESTQMEFEIAGPNDQVRQFIEKWLPDVDGKEALEIGCVPGRYLACLGEKGYTLNGIDIISGALKQTELWLQQKGYATTEFLSTSFEEFSPSKKFDVVCSFGFIEHYEDYMSAIEKHINLVASKGYVIITTPNFRGGLQNRLHKWLDHENLNRHNVDSMRPERWAKRLSQTEFNVLYQGYFGYFTFWVGETDHRSPFKSGMVNAIKWSLPLSSRLLPSNTMSISPFCGVVARRKN